jgi:hypothetical protein
MSINSNIFISFLPFFPFQGLHKKTKPSTMKNPLLQRRPISVNRPSFHIGESSSPRQGHVLNRSYHQTQQPTSVLLSCDKESNEIPYNECLLCADSESNSLIEIERTLREGDAESISLSGSTLCNNIGVIAVDGEAREVGVELSQIVDDCDQNTNSNNNNDNCFSRKDLDLVGNESTNNTLNDKPNLGANDCFVFEGLVHETLDTSTTPTSSSTSSSASISTTITSTTLSSSPLPTQILTDHTICNEFLISNDGVKVSTHCTAYESENVDTVESRSDLSLALVPYIPNTLKLAEGYSNVTTKTLHQESNTRPKSFEFSSKSLFNAIIRFYASVATLIVTFYIFVLSYVITILVKILPMLIAVAKISFDGAVTLVEYGVVAAKVAGRGAAILYKAVNPL